MSKDTTPLFNSISPALLQQKPFVVTHERSISTPLETLFIDKNPSLGLEIKGSGESYNEASPFPALSPGSGGSYDEPNPTLTLFKLPVFNNVKTLSFLPFVTLGVYLLALSPGSGGS